MKDVTIAALARFRETSTHPWPILQILIGGIKAHWLFFALALFYMMAINLFMVTEENSIRHDIGLLTLNLLTFTIPTLLIAIITLRFLNLAIYLRPKRPLAALWQDLKEFFSDHRRMANGIPMVLAIVLFIRCFSYVKSNIPFVNPFSWDETFMEWDKWLHFGVHPWEILQPLLGFPVITFLINIIYNVWFMVMWCIWCWLAFSRENSHLRIQFFLAFMLTWGIGGGVLATMLSSAGPAFYGAIGLSPDPYQALMTYLYDVDDIVPLWALNIQQALWAGYTAQPPQNIGISAMPSMHNGTALLFAFVGWRISRRAGIALTAFAVAIFLGSVHLGWHYAIDAYFVFVLAGLAWWVSGKIATWYLATSLVKEHERQLAAVLDR